jgi:4-amino-4-deoxy-L-arabinose transferase-like glycosyltransferase
VARVNEHKKELLVVVLLALLLSLPWLDRAFSSRGEPREALVAQAMVATGNWISPPAYDGAVPSKPPFSHWLISLASLPQGDASEFTSRLPSSAGFVGFLGAFYLFVARRTSALTGLLASLILMTTFEWFRCGVTCRVDLILSVSMAGALLALFSWSEKGQRGFPFLASIFIAAAALTKGPIGIVLPLAIYSLYQVTKQRLSFWSLVSIGLRAVMIAIPVGIVVSGWYFAGYLQRGDAFIEKIYYENFARFTSTMEDEPHKHNALYLFGMLLVGLLPWSISLLTLAAREWRVVGDKLCAWRSVWQSASPLIRFSFLAASCIFVFFCIPSSKRSVYVLPAYPFIAIIAAEYAEFWGRKSQRLLAVLASGFVGFTALVASVVCVVVAFPFRPELEAFQEAFVATVTSQRLLVVLALILALRIWGREIIRGLQSNPVGRLGFAVWLTVVLMSLLVIEPIMYQLSPKGWLQKSEVVEALNVSKHEKYYSFGSEQYAMSFYLKKPFFRATADLPVGSLVFVEERNIDRLKNEIAPNIREVARFQSGLEPKKKAVVVVEKVG